MIRLVVLLLLVVAVIWLLATMVRAVRPRGAVVAAPVHARVREIKELAWDHRDLDPALAGTLIDRIRAFDRAPDPGILDDLLELAWMMREESPELSEIVISTIRGGGPRRLG